VDDILVSAQNVELLRQVKQQLQEQLAIKDLGSIRSFLHFDFELKGNKCMAMSQTSYIEKLVKTFKLENSSPRYRLPPVDTIKIDGPIDHTVPYRQIIGGLLYVANWTRPDICAVVSYLSSFTSKPTFTHYRYALQVLSYLNT